MRELRGRLRTERGNLLPEDSMFRFLSRLVVGLTCITSGCAPLGAPEVLGPELSDVPAIPIPLAPGGDVAAQSESIVQTVPLLGTDHFEPRVSRAYARWTLAEQLLPGNDWTYAGLGWHWSHELPEPVSSSGLPSVPPPEPLSIRLVLVDGDVVDAPRALFDAFPAGSFLQHRLVMDAAPFAGDLYVTRVRRWVLDSFDGTGSFLLVESNQSVELSESRTEGSSESEIRSFATTVTQTAGLEFEGISAGLERTLSESFATSITVTEERTREVRLVVDGEPGVRIDLRLWRLVDSFTLTDAAGAPLTDPSYVFDESDSTLSWSTVAGTWAVQTKFPF